MATISMMGSGEERARRAALLALVTVFMAAGFNSGCKSVAPPIAPLHAVQISALLPLHPAWRQLEDLEAQARQPEHVSLNLPFTPVVLPEPFILPRGLPPSRVTDHEKVVREDAARYTAQLEASLAVRNRELTEAERHAAAQLARTEYDSALEKRENELRDVAVANTKVLQQQLEQLNYRLEALASQSRVYSAVGANARRMLDDVKLQQAEVDRRAQLKSTEITGMLKADFKGLAQESLKSYKGALDATAANQAAEFQRKQSQADEQEIAEAKARVDSQPTPITPLLDRSGDISNAGATALIQRVSAPKTTVFELATAAASKTDQTQRRALVLEIERLRTMIADDTRKAVDEIARRERWTVTERSKAGSANDWTGRVATELRRQWNPTPTR